MEALEETELTPLDPGFYPAARSGVILASFSSNSFAVAAWSSLSETRALRAIAVLIAAGLSDDEIAARLGFGSGAVTDCVEEILRHLGVTRRTQIAAWAVAADRHHPPQGGRPD